MSETTSTPHSSGPKHQHDWHELGRAFYLTDADTDLESLSPHGLHDPETGELVTAAEAKEQGGKILALLKSKVPEPESCVILQCQDPKCPDGPKHIEHIALTDGEFEKLKAAFDEGKLDPDHNGSQRLLSTLPLSGLGLGRIEKMLGEGRLSGASESVV